MRCRVRTTLSKLFSLCATHPTNPNSHCCATLTLRTLLTALTSLPENLVRNVNAGGILTYFVIYFY